MIMQQSCHTAEQNNIRTRCRDVNRLARAIHYLFRQCNMIPSDFQPLGSAHATGFLCATIADECKLKGITRAPNNQKQEETSMSTQNREKSSSMRAMSSHLCTNLNETTGVKTAICQWTLTTLSEPTYLHLMARELDPGCTGMSPLIHGPGKLGN